MENCAIYSHYVAIEKIISVVQQFFPHDNLELTGSESEWSELNLVSGKTFWKKGITFILSYRQRSAPDYELNLSEEPIIKNLVGMYDFFRSFPAKSPDVQSRLLQKLATSNTEVGVTIDSEKLDQADLYYRMDWACVKVRVKRQVIVPIHAGAVNERH